MDRKRTAYEGITEEKVLTEKNYMWRLSQEFYKCTVSVIFSMRCMVLLAVRNGH